MNDVSTGSSPLPRAVAAGALTLGGATLGAYVLTDKRRVVSQRSLLRTFGWGLENGGVVHGVLPNGASIFVVGRSVRFRTADGCVAVGRDGTALVAICDAYVDALVDGVLHSTQVPIARTARALLRAIHTAGVDVLIDEATDYPSVPRAEYRPAFIAALVELTMQGGERRQSEHGQQPRPPDSARERRRGRPARRG